MRKLTALIQIAPVPVKATTTKTLRVVREPPLRTLERRIKRRLSLHLRQVGLNPLHHGEMEMSKDSIRLCHQSQRTTLLNGASSFIVGNAKDLLPFFASGVDISVDKITPRLQPISAATLEAKLFRFASYTWSVPVSEGFGRRMRFLVWDEYNDKLIGILALGDPVFNLNVRDKHIKWTSADRKDRLVNIMDAYVLGALPPYNMLLGGKLVSCLVRSQEIRDTFEQRYSNSRGIISHAKKHAHLVMVTTSSSLGRSSVYNRLRIGGIGYFERIGYTAGFGHFHVPPDLFDLMREYLQRRRHSYAKGNRFGNGPNWKFRAIRAALELMNVNRDILRHGIRREVFASQLARNANESLRHSSVVPDYSDLLSVKEIGQLAVERWMKPRALRATEFLAWSNQDILKLLLS